MKEIISFLVGVGALGLALKFIKPILIKNAKQLGEKLEPLVDDKYNEYIRGAMEATNAFAGALTKSSVDGNSDIVTNHQIEVIASSVEEQLKEQVKNIVVPVSKQEGSTITIGASSDLKGNDKVEAGFSFKF